ncbi:hypothetical protein Tdes44962_MAKER01732 [Teratosphaeria destructans]|uniref:Uncharacterized protein n=1 Tax=Teratosphaeria destructans TaxID=418781 RepID=A0A9W7SXI0_9PEZI|nr:hypothetical protein Tdes44962_MAKER01732 [Teratosphaeria destructans]
MPPSTKTTTTKRASQAPKSRLTTKSTTSRPKTNALGDDMDDASSLSPSDSLSMVQTPPPSRKSTSSRSTSSDGGNDSDGARSSKSSRAATESSSRTESRGWVRTTRITVPRGKDVEVRIRYG